MQVQPLGCPAVETPGHNQVVGGVMRKLLPTLVEVAPAVTPINSIARVAIAMPPAMARVPAALAVVPRQCSARRQSNNAGYRERPKQDADRTIHVLLHFAIW